MMMPKWIYPILHVISIVSVMMLTYCVGFLVFKGIWYWVSVVPNNPNLMVGSWTLLFLVLMATKTITFSSSWLER